MNDEQAYFTIDGKDTYDPKALFAEVERLEAEGISSGIELSRVARKCNSWTFPRGFEPGRGYFLMIGKDVAAIADNGGVQTATHTLRIYRGTTEVRKFEKLIITHAYAVTGGLQHSDETLYVVELADLRILGPLTSIDKAYNVKTPDLADIFDATQNSGSNWTFSTMVSDIWTLVPSAMGSLTTTDADFSGEPLDYNFRGVTAWDALRKVLDDTQHLLVLSPSGTFSVIAAFSDDSEALDEEMETNSEHLVSGSLDKYATIHKIPATYRVFFPKRDLYWHGNADTKVNTIEDHQKLNPLLNKDVTTSSLTGHSDRTTITGTVGNIHDSKLAEYGHTGSISNDAALTTRAELLALRAANAAAFAEVPLNVRYHGARSFTMNNGISGISWYDFGRGLFTEIRTIPRCDPLSPLLSPPITAWSSLPEKTLWSAFEPNTPPDIARWQGMGLRVALARLTGGTLAKGGNQTATLYYWNGSAWTASTKTITVYDFFLNSDLTLEDETRIFAMLLGTVWVALIAYCEAQD